MPPIICASGPFEIGDGDGYYEIGEKVLFRIDIRDTDLQSVEFLINDKVIRTSNAPGKFEQILTLSLPGEYRFAIRARDENGTLETFVRGVPVSMQKDRAYLKVKQLPADYGQTRTMMRCPECGKVFSQDVHYCPYDGRKLNVFEKVVHGLLDTSLVGAGI